MELERVVRIIELLKIAHRTKNLDDAMQLSEFIANHATQEVKGLKSTINTLELFIIDILQKRGWTEYVLPHSRLEELEREWHLHRDSDAIGIRVELCDAPKHIQALKILLTGVGAPATPDPKAESVLNQLKTVLAEAFGGKEWGAH